VSADGILYASVASIWVRTVEVVAISLSSFYICRCLPVRATASP
jgi:hypothetical protein